MFKNGDFMHFLGFSGACHGLVLAKPRLLCPEIAQKRFCPVSCVSCRGLVFALRGHAAALYEGFWAECVFGTF